MGNRKSILKNTLALAVPNIFNPIVSFVLVLVISRYLGVEGLGQFSLVLSYIGIFATLASLGLADLVVREVARRRDRAHEFLFNAGAFGTLSSLVALVLMNFLVASMGYEEHVVQAAFICSFSLVASTAITYMEAIFRSYEKAEFVALTYVIENLVRVGSCIVLLLTGYSIVALFVAILASRVFAFLLMFAFYVKVMGKPGCTFNRDTWKMLARESATFTSIAIFSTIHLSLDQIMLSKLKSIEAVGIYSAADRLLDMCRTLPLAFAAALLPFLTKEYALSLDRLQQLATYSTRYLLLGSLPIVVGTAILADDMVRLIYGAEFSAAGPVLRLHIFSLIPFSLVFFLAQLLIATDNQRVDLAINIAAAGLNFVLNLLFIPVLAELGAALATLLTVLVFSLLQWWYIRKHLFTIRLLNLLPKALSASVIMGVVTYALRDWNLFVNIAISAVVYVGLLIVLKALSPEESEFLKRVVLSKRDYHG
jgi:O-antigen/teichoic acid export membrane protein